jgi:cardiolipin synthase
VHTAFIVIACIAIGFQSLILFLAFFGPDLPYRVEDPPESPLDSEEFLSLLAVLTDAQIHCRNSIEVLTNGNCFYDGQLTAIGEAQQSINLEAYIFHRGDIGRRFVEALADRARAGVKVRVVIDYIGSFSVFRTYFKELTEAGFIGGAGISDQWYKSTKRNPRWRDTVVRVEGPAVTSLQSVFAQNWLRVAGEILTSRECFSFPPDQGNAAGLVVNSTPAEGSTRARILFQTLMASAKKKIYISTPYFLPDRSARQAILRAVTQDGVDVKILTPGTKSDHMLTRSSSRRLYGKLLKAGAQVYEYEPSMIHVKAMMIDDLWAVVGSTNFDHRSFEINDEVNLAILDKAVTSRLVDDFERDLEQSKRITYSEWRRKMRFRLDEWIGSLFERQE